MPDEPEALGLLALMLLHESAAAGPGGRRRRPGAAGAAGPVSLGSPSHRRGPGVARSGPAPPPARALSGAGGHRRLPCRRRPAPRQTDWPQIAALYRQLARMAPSPVVELNLAVAVAMAEGPAAGLARVEALEASGALAGYHLLAATRADLLRRLGPAGRSRRRLPGRHRPGRQRRRASVPRPVGWPRWAIPPARPSRSGSPGPPRPAGAPEVEAGCHVVPWSHARRVVLDPGRPVRRPAGGRPGVLGVLVDHCGGADPRCSGPSDSYRGRSRSGSSPP